MKLVIAAVGRLKNGPERDLATHYVERLKRQGRAIALAPVEHVELAAARARAVERRKSDEAGRLVALAGATAGGAAFWSRSMSAVRNWRVSNSPL